MIIISRNRDVVAAFDQASLVKAKSNAVAEVNRAVGQARLSHLTDIPGQQAIYAEKATEAAAYVAMDPPPKTLDDFPLLAAEVAITAPDAWQLAQIWLNMQTQLRRVGAQSEQLRLGTQKAIESAPTAADVADVLVYFTTVLTETNVEKTRK
jgi:hypothetical protein